MRQRRPLLPLLLALVLLASYSIAPVSGHADSEAALVLLDTIETGGQPSAIVVDQAVNRHDVIFYDADRVRFLDGDTLTIASEPLMLPTAEWHGWIVYDDYHHQAYVVTTRRRETPMRVAWQEVQVHVVADRTLRGSFSVNETYNTDPLDPVDRFYGLNGLALKPPMSEGANPARLILDATANGTIDVVDLDATGTAAARIQRHSYRESLCDGQWCSWETNQGNTVALEAGHETQTPDDLATVDHLYVADPNYEDQGLPAYGHVRKIQINHPAQNLDPVPLPDLDLSGTWPFGTGNQGLAMATGSDLLYVASGQQSFNTGYVGQVNTLNDQVKQVIELTYGDLGFVDVDPQDPRRVFATTFDGWYNDPDQALYLHLLYDGHVVDTLKLIDDYDEYDGLQDAVYDPTHQRFYLTVGSRILVVQVNHGSTCPNPIADVEISGPTLGETDSTYTFRAAVDPSNATPPVAYTWSPMPLSGQGTATATYRWATAGDHTMAVEVENCGGKRSATREVKILAEELEQVDLPLVVR